MLILKASFERANTFSLVLLSQRKTIFNSIKPMFSNILWFWLNSRKRKNFKVKDQASNITKLDKIKDGNLL